MSDRINIPAWNHFPFVGYLHYRSKITSKFMDTPQKIILPPLNPYLGFFNHAEFVNKVVLTKEVGTQTDPDKAMELGQQIIDKMGYD